MKRRFSLALFILLTFSTLTLFQNCTNDYKVAPNANLLNSSEPVLTCDFNGNVLTEGQSVTAYLNSTVASGDVCQPQTRICSNGQLSGSYTFASCSVNAPAACMFNGQTIQSGAGVTAYQSSTVPYGQECVAETRACNNGQLSGSYTFGSCAPAMPAACLFNGKTILNGQSVTAYQASSVPFGQTCNSQTLTCNNGQLSGGSFAFASCIVDGPQSCLFNNQTIPSGSSVVAYLSDSVSAGQTCTSETRVCNNGQLSGSYTNASCTTLVCDPFTNPSATCKSTTAGLKGSLFYEPQATVAAEGGWAQLSTFFSRGTQSNITLVLSQLNVPAENFSNGFPIGNGQLLTDNNGNVLLEWFALQVDGILKLAPGDAAGNYEFATLSDDGSILYLRDSSTGQLVPRVKNDGQHSEAMACIDSPVYMDSTTQIPMRLQYFQGPRYQIAMRMLYRPASSQKESLCGQTQSSSVQFYNPSSSGNPYQDGSAMQKLYNDGWKIVAPSQFGSPN